MDNNTQDFEAAAIKQGYIIERIKKNEFNKITTMYGSIRSGIYVRPVRWNHLGHCFSRRGKALSKYNLKLQSL